MRSVGARWEASSGTPRTDIDFAIDGLDVRIDRIRAQDELVGILFVTHAHRCQAQHIDCPLRHPASYGRVLMIYVFIALQDALARWWARRTPEWHSRLPRPRPVPSAWRPLMVLSGLRGALSLALVLGLPTKLELRNLLTDIVYDVTW